MQELKEQWRQEDIEVEVPNRIQDPEAAPAPELNFLALLPNQTMDHPITPIEQQLQHLDSDDYLSEEENFSTTTLWELPYERHDQDDESYGIEDLFMPTDELKLEDSGCSPLESRANMDYTGFEVPNLSNKNLPDFCDEIQDLEAESGAETIFQPGEIENEDSRVTEDEDLSEIEEEKIEDLSFSSCPRSKIVMGEREILKPFDFIDPFLKSPSTHNNFFLLILQQPKLIFDSYHGCMQDALLQDHPLHAIIHIKLSAWKAFSRIG